MTDVESAAFDKDWNEFVALFNNDGWAEFKGKALLIEKLKNHEDIAIVAFGQTMQYVFDWIEGEVINLDNLRPIDCLKDEVLLRKLKGMLMSFPR